VLFIGLVLLHTMHCEAQDKSSLSAKLHGATRSAARAERDAVANAVAGV